MVMHAGSLSIMDRRRVEGYTSIYGNNRYYAPSLLGGRVVDETAGLASTVATVVDRIMGSRSGRASLVNRVPIITI